MIDSVMCIVVLSVHKCPQSFLWKTSGGFATSATFALGDFRQPYSLLCPPTWTNFHSCTAAPMITMYRFS